MAAKGQGNLINELSKLVQKKEKMQKKILISLTDNEHKAIKQVAEKLNTTVSEVVKNTLKLQGLFNSTNSDKKETKGE